MSGIPDHHPLKVLGGSHRGHQEMARQMADAAKEAAEQKAGVPGAEPRDKRSLAHGVNRGDLHFYGNPNCSWQNPNFYGKSTFLMGFIPGLVNCYITMENPLIFNGKTPYFYGHFQ